MAPSGCHCDVGQLRKEEENPGSSRTFQDFGIQQRKSRESPKEIQVLGVDTIRSMGMWSVLEKLLERHSSFPGMALVPALFICPGVSTEPENSMLFIGTSQEILLLEFPFG